MERVVRPVGRLVYDYIAQPVGELLLRISTIVFDAILFPSYKALESAVVLLNQKILQPAAAIFSAVMQQALVEFPKQLHSVLIVSVEHIGQVAAAAFKTLKQTFPFSAVM